MEWSHAAIPGVELLRELGRGAYSVVYKARRNGRHYALKLPLTSETGAKAKLLTQRFLREAVALARVRHPALPEVMEVGRTDRMPYIIMELAAGQTLSERLERAPLDERQIVELGIQLSDALSHIHQSGLVHRDVKPKNILFDSQTTAVRLVDFGFAASFSAGPRIEAAGTPAYAAPEQTSSARERVDERADLYSLGCVLFECLAGVPPKPDAFSERDEEALDSPASVVYQASPALTPILKRLLARNPDERYSSAALVHEDLARLSVALDGGAAGASRAKQQQRARLATSPLVGRARELSRLRQAWTESRAGRGQVVLLRGAAGSGKTRLLDALVGDARENGDAVLAAACQASDPQPFSAVRQLLEASLQKYEALPIASRLRAIARLRAMAGDLAPLLTVISPALARVFEKSTQIPQSDSAEHAFTEGIAGFISKLLADLGPTLIVVDDVQWIDGSSRRVLARVADRSASNSVLCVFAARAEASPQVGVERLVGGLRRSALTTISLSSFAESEIAELVTSYLGAMQIDPELTRYVSSLSDGTPLSVIEILRTMLEASVLVPYWGRWQLDVDAATAMQLSGQTSALLDRRIDDLDRMTVTTLTAAAVVGKVFEDAVLPGVCELEEGHVHAALAEARRALLIQSMPNSAHRFMHDSVREALLKRLRADALCAVHQRVAETLDALGSARGLARADLPWSEVLPDELALATSELDRHIALGNEIDPTRTDFCYALATHYWHGERGRDAKRVYESNVIAGKLAFRSFDNERALFFFDAACEAAGLLGRPLDPELEFTIGEAHLRSALLEDSLRHFRQVVTAAKEPLLQALALSRIAWVEMQLESTRAFSAALEAFEKLGVPAPSSSIWALIWSALCWFWFSAFPAKISQDPRERRQLEGVCSLYYLVGRLASQSAKPVQVIVGAFRALIAAQRLGPSGSLTKTYLMYSYVLSAIGLRARARRYLDKAEAVAKELSDPALMGHVHQLHFTIAAWSGDMRGAIEAGTRCLEEYGHLRELSDYSLIAYNLHQIETVRGRNLEAWRWVEALVQRLAQYEREPMVLDFVERSVRATLLGLGRETEADAVLARLRSTTVSAKCAGLFVSALGAQVRLFTERAELGDAFEKLVREVKVLYPNPRRAHREVIDFYVHVAHARLQACLTASDQARPELQASFYDALADLKSVVHDRLYEAHFRVLSGYAAYFQARFRRAERSFAVAERLARLEGAPWVLYAVCRGRAFMCQANGHTDAALDQAALAEVLARENGCPWRVKWIREDFPLRSVEKKERARATRASLSSFDPLSSSSSRFSAHYLRALTRVGHATADELEPAYQARLALDELIGEFVADSGVIFLNEENGLALRSEAPGNSVLAARDAQSRDISAPCAMDAVEQVIASGCAGIVRVSPASSHGFVFSAQTSGIAAPLCVQGRTIGALLLLRSSPRGAYNESELESFSALAEQVVLLLELSCAMYARQRADRDVRTAQKMEALGRLAGSMAHDFNNMLAAISAAAESALHAPGGASNDLLTIQNAASRARYLTRQLLVLSPGQHSVPETLQLNDCVTRLTPEFERLVGEHIQLELALSQDLRPIRADGAQLEQVLLNLVVNATDAMPGGGLLRIATQNVDATQSRSGLHEVVLEVTDTGRGMDAATRSKLFEPFFTTKLDKSSLGLGLWIAHAIVTQSGGRIEATSAIDRGSRFRIVIPASREALSLPPPRSDIRDIRAKRVLLVDDEPLVRESLRRMLKQLGCQVVPAASAREALGILERADQDLDLVITDVIMPDMNGLELAREVSRLRADLPVLFISGYTNGVLAERGILREGAALLEKPVTFEGLRQRITGMFQPAPLEAERAATGARD